MTSQDMDRIYSNDYADLLISYGGDTSVFNKFKNAAIHIVNYFQAVVHVPVRQITDSTIDELGYAVMPQIFGLTGQEELEASGILKVRGIPSLNLRGKGVLIGILDTGIDYTNPIFQYADKTTRIVSIWDQTIVSDNYPDNTLYGTEYNRDQINAALKSDNPLSAVLSVDDNGHGTMLAGIAAGNEVPESGFYGVAPDAELLVVKLKPAKAYLKEFFRIPKDILCFQESDILFGLQYLINKAVLLNQPMALCVALGSSMGSHDGRGILSNYLSFQADRAGLAVIVAAGNEGASRRHYYGVIDPNKEYNQVELNIGENESGFSMELWGESPNLFSIDITTPSGEYIPKIISSLNENRIISFIFEKTIINIDFQMVESLSGDQLILIRFQDPAPGIWRFRVYGTGIAPLSFHIWLPMNGFISDGTYFIHPDPYNTVVTLANGVVPITVTAYNTVDDSLYQNASRGYTRSGIIKPEIAAPGVNLLSPTLNKGFAGVTGTSAGAAFTTGVAALLMEWGIVNKNYSDMSTLDMKIFMVRGARRDASIKYPNRDWGYGILDVFSIFDKLRT